MKITIKQDNGTLTIIGNNHWREIEYELPEDEKGECRPFVRYKGEKDYLDEYAVTEQVYDTGWQRNYSGIKPNSFFSGRLIRFNKHCDSVQVFRFYC